MGVVMMAEGSEWATSSMFIPLFDSKTREREARGQLGAFDSYGSRSLEREELELAFKAEEEEEKKRKGGRTPEQKQRERETEKFGRRERRRSTPSREEFARRA